MVFIMQYILRKPVNKINSIEITLIEIEISLRVINFDLFNSIRSISISIQFNSIQFNSIQFNSIQIK